MTKPTHGGRREGAGRKPKKNARTSVFSLAVSADDKQLLDDTDARSWAPAMIIRAAKRKAKQ